MAEKGLIRIRRSDERGRADHGWLKSRFSFSFADYVDPEHMGYRSLRVINDDWIEGAKGFGMHPHQDMEIISYVVEGALAHKDNMGNESTIVPGKVLRMSAGTGLLHSEYNPLDRRLHLLQIWITPDRQGLAPEYEEAAFSDADKQGGLCLIGSRDGREGSVTIHQDVNLYASMLGAGDTLTVPVEASRYVWIQLVEGQLKVNGEALETGDAAALSGVEQVHLAAGEGAEFLLFDLA
jgi:redox-sensitive bicupin YhaK (pirin superfamily)